MRVSTSVHAKARGSVFFRLSSLATTLAASRASALAASWARGRQHALQPSEATTTSPMSAALAEADVVASRSWPAWLLTRRVLFGAHSTVLVLPFGGGRALRLPLCEASARAAIAAARALLALALVLLVVLALRRRRCGRGGAAGRAPPSASAAQEEAGPPLWRRAVRCGYEKKERNK